MTRPSILRRALIALALLTLLASCAPPPPAPPPPELPPPAVPALELVTQAEWPLMEDDLDLASLAEAAGHSLAYLRRANASQTYDFAGERYSAAEMAQGITRLQEILRQNTQATARTTAIRREFNLYRASGRDGQGTTLFTGYYEPVLEARRHPVKGFTQPLYATPNDLISVDLSQFSSELPKRQIVGRVSGKKLIPYHERDAIEHQNVLQGQAQILAWVADPVEAFFLHIQGSGQVHFSDGGRLRLGYATNNGRPYRAIAKLLMDEGLMTLDEMSMQSIKRLLEKRPDLRRRVLSYNPSYVFFRPLSPEGGPLGCYELPLTAGRSVATDRRVFPGLAMCFISGDRPEVGRGTASFSRFVLNQDTGGAIRGPGRLDLFYGSGPAAGELAGRMKHKGRLYFLAPRRS